jgi:hypothetical protein
LDPPLESLITTIIEISLFNLFTERRKFYAILATFGKLNC